MTGNPQFMPKLPLSVPQHTVLACFLHSNSCESLSRDFIRDKMGCFLEEQNMLIHIGLLTRITEYSNEGICGSPLQTHLKSYSILFICFSYCSLYVYKI